MKLNLVRALRVDRDACMAFVGAGGKTTAINLIATELSPPLVVTTTTHIGRSQLKPNHRHIEYKKFFQLSELLPVRDEIMFITGKAIDEERMAGLDEPILEELCKMAGKKHIPIFIEADGSRRLPLKAPAIHEPNIPGFTKQVVVVVGLSSLGKPFSDEIVHRANEAMQITGIKKGQTITKENLNELLCHPYGGLKNIPDSSRRIALLNQADSPDLQNQGRTLAQQLLGPYDSVVLSSLNPGGLSTKTNKVPDEVIYNVYESTAGVILAAGESSRYGRPKLLVNWKGEPIIRHVVLHAMKAGLSPIILVLGSILEPIINVIRDLPVSIVVNKKWKEGQSSSLREGIRALHQGTGSAIFLLGDQPQIPVDLIMALKHRHEETLDPLIIPQVNGERANPVLFDRDAFDELTQVEGDQGGRAVFKKYPISWIPWEDESILLDIDTPEDYDKLLAIG